MKITAIAEATKGGLIFSDLMGLIRDIRQWDGKKVYVTIEKAKSKRSNSQNAYLWSVVYPCALHGFVEAGNEGVCIDEVHTFFKQQFLKNGKDVFIPGSGEVVKLGNTTTTLSKTEMMIYIEQIAKFCAEMLGVVIPEPMPLMPV